MPTGMRSGDRPAGAPSAAHASGAQPPPLPPRWLRRSRVNEALRAGEALPTTLVTAPAGFGKTSAVVDWLRTAHQPAWWVSCADPAISANQLEPLLVARLRELERDPASSAIVLDDVDVLRHETIEAAHGVLTALPARARLVLIARSLPPRLPVGRWRWRGELFEVGPDALAFTRAETATYLRRGWRLEVDDATVARVWQWTGGWPAVLTLIAAHERSNGAVDEPFLRDGVLAGQLLRAVLDREADADVELLTRCAVLDVLDAQVCADIVGAGALARLQQLVRAGLVVRDADDALHHRRPLRDLLERDLAARQPKALDALRTRAARSLADHGRPAAAVVQAVDAGEHAFGLDLLDGHRAALVVLDGGVTLLDLARRFRVDAVAARSSLAFTLVDVAALARDIAYLRQLLAAAGPWLEDTRDLRLHAQATLARLTGVGSAALCEQTGPSDFAALAHLRGVEAEWDGHYAEAELLLLSAATDAARSQDRLRELVVLVDLAWKRARAGRLAAAEYTIASVAQLSVSLGVQQPATYIELALASIAADRGQHADAARRLAGIEERHDTRADHLLAFDLLMARLWIEHRPATTAQMLERLDELRAAHRGQNGGALVRRLASAEALLRLRSGDVDGALAAVPGIATAHDHRPLPPTDRLLLAALLLRTGSAARARDVAASVTAEANGPRLATMAARIRTRAEAARTGQQQLAAVPHRPSLAGAWQGGRGRERPQLTAPETATWVDGVPVLAEVLTAREREIVALLPSSLVYQGMADELGISLNTLKTHLKSVYRKLDARSRWDAIARAHQLGLFEELESHAPGRPWSGPTHGQATV